MQRSKIVIGSFNSKTWNDYGICWVASLSKIKFAGDVAIINEGLSLQIVNHLKKININIVENLYDFLEGKNGIVAIWSHRAFFQDNIDDVFEIAKGKICSGNDFINDFYAFDLCYFDFLKGTVNCLSDCGINSISAIWASCHNKKEISNIWNYKLDYSLQWENGFYHNKQKIKVLSIPEIMRKSPAGCKLYFYDRFNEEYKIWDAYFRGKSFEKIKNKIFKGN